MPRIFLLPDQRYVEASDLETVLSASLRVGIPITNECRGNARCSTCRVLVLNGLGYCSPRSEKERALAEQLHFSDRVRLACQTTITGNVTMRRLILDAEDAGLTDQRKEATAHGLVGEERQIAGIASSGFGRHDPILRIARRSGEVKHVGAQAIMLPRTGTSGRIPPLETKITVFFGS